MNNLVETPASNRLMADMLVQFLTAAVARLRAEPSITFSEVYDQYYQRHVLVNMRGPMRLERWLWRVHCSYFADYPITSIRRRDVQAWLDDIAINNGKNTANRAIESLSAIFNWAMDADICNGLTTNPCTRVRRFARSPRDRFIQPAELIALDRSLSRESDTFKDLVWCWLLTGQRPGTVQRMKFDEVDQTLGIWRIPITKTGIPHQVPLTSRAIAIIRRRQEASEPGCPWVFPSPRKKGAFYRCPERAWKRTLARAGLTNLWIYDCRRTAGSYLAIDGNSQYIIGKLLGHRDPRSTSVYARLNLRPVRDAVEQVQNKWLDILGQRSHEKRSEPEAEPLIKSPPMDPMPTKAERKISRRDQVFLEAAVLRSLQNADRSKAELSANLSYAVADADELQRILEEMTDRGLLETYVKQSHNTHVRYRLAPDDVLSKLTDEPELRCLSPQQKAVLACIAEGLSNPQISKRLGLTVYTVKTYARTLFRKLGVVSREQAAQRARELSLVS